MRLLNWTNGLICGGLTAALSMLYSITQSLHHGDFLWVPIIAIAFWGGTAFHELTEENDRRGRIPRRLGVSEIDELTQGS